VSLFQLSPFQQSPLQLGVFYLQTGATAALILRLGLSGLSKIYKSFFAYLAIQLAEFVALVLVSFHARFYGFTYFAGQGVRVVLSVFVVLEVYQLALADQPALARFGQRTVGYVLGAAALAAICGLALDSSVPPGQSIFLHHFLSFERTMDVWLLIFLLLISLFLLWFPVRLKKNVALYIGGFVVYSFARSFGLLFVNMLPVQFTIPLGTAMLAVSISCLAVWVFELRREGEEVTTVIGHRWNPAAMGRLMDQLKSINASLARLPRS
jgi:hypothetical protein